MTAPDREELVRLSALVDADRAQLGHLDSAIGSLYESRRVVRERMEANEARLRSLEAGHYAALVREVEAQ